MDSRETISSLEHNAVGRLIHPAVFTSLKRVVPRGKTLTFIDDLHA